MITVVRGVWVQHKTKKRYFLYINTSYSSLDYRSSPDKSRRLHQFTKYYRVLLIQYLVVSNRYLVRKKMNQINECCTSKSARVPPGFFLLSLLPFPTGPRLPPSAPRGWVIYWKQLRNAGAGVDTAGALKQQKIRTCMYVPVEQDVPTAVNCCKKMAGSWLFFFALIHHSTSKKWTWWTPCCAVIHQ